ncbi:piwi-like protein Siwi, partial [Aphis craccivora]
MENSLRGRGQALGPTPPLPRHIQPQFRRPEEEQKIRLPRVEEDGQTSKRINSSERGSKGQPTELISNYFPITTYTDWSLYQYRVDFNPVQERTNIQRELLSAHNKFLGAYICDGKMLFSIKQFESDTTELVSKRNTDGQTVLITLKFTSVIKMGDYASIHVFNLLKRKFFGNLNLTLTGRNYYEADVKITFSNHKLQLWPGYETTVQDLLIERSKTRNANPQWM